MRPRWGELSGNGVAQRGRPSILATAIEVLSRPRNQGMLVVVAALTTFAYTILLPYDFTQRFSIANWAYLSPGLVAWSVVLGTGVAFAIVLQIHATSRLAVANTGAVSGLAFVASLLPSFLCCTPILPTVLAFVGLSAATLYRTSVDLQYFFAIHQTPFLVGSLALVALAVWMGLRKLAASCTAGSCATGRSQSSLGCGPGQPTGGVMR